MVISNHKRIGLALELLKMGAAPYIGREIKSAVKRGYIPGYLIHDYVEDPTLLKKEISQWELSPLLKLMDDTWNLLFQNTLGFAEHSILGELREWLAKWDHQASISNDDTDRILDSVVRFLNAISATDVAADAERMKKEFRKFIYEEQVRSEEQSEAAQAEAGDDTETEKHDLVESGATDTLKSWREVVTPLADVTGGRYLETEFAADLWQVHQGEAADEYREPVDFFQRTYLTESIRQLMASSIRRISGMEGDPVVLLVSGFGGGKTHSLLALYHLFSGANTADLAGVEPLMKESEVFSLPIVKRAVLVGNKISPGTPSVKPNGLTIRTLWGELAYQLGGKKAFEKIRDHDKKKTSPGDKKLRDLFKSCGPCLILVDEWVSYARQLADQKDLPGGTLKTQIAFARDLVSAAKQSKNCLLVISLPVAAEAGQASSKIDDIEVGGIHGMEALSYLQNEIGQAESSWKPATPEEDLEIVRCRLFEPVPPQRDKFIKMTAMAFTELYIQKRLDFPAETQTSLYKRRMQAAYPIHPEIFDRLYHDWSSLIRFQRTRGVLRLMATVIHCLWEKKDRNPLILPSTMPVNDVRVQAELTRYQPDDWPEVIQRDVDGPEAVSHKIDAANTHLGQLYAARRVARTICIGSTPVAEGLQQGVDEQHVMLGCVMPGESPAIFHDAIRHLADESTYLNIEGGHFWYTSRPSLLRMAIERAGALSEESETVSGELEKRLLAQLGTHEDFAEVHLSSGPSEVIPDELSCQLVVLPVDQPYCNDTDNPAVYTAKSILENCGESPRKYRNTLVFLAADESGIDELDESVRMFLAWDSILKEKKQLKLDDEQLKQVEEYRRSTENKINKRIHASYKWVLLPTRTDPEQPETWKAVGLDRADTLAESAALTLRDKMLMLSALDATTLRVYLDELSLWNEDHVPVQQLVRDFAGMNHLPRVAGPHVLLDAVREGIALSTWDEDSYAWADGYDQKSGLFEGLKAGEAVDVTEVSEGVLVRAERAAAQLTPVEETEAAEPVAEETAVAEAEVDAAETAAAETDAAEEIADEVVADAVTAAAETDAEAEEADAETAAAETDTAEEIADEVVADAVTAAAEATAEDEEADAVTDTVEEIADEVVADAVTAAAEATAEAETGETDATEEAEASESAEEVAADADGVNELQKLFLQKETIQHANKTNGVNGASSNGAKNGSSSHRNGTEPPNFHQRVTLDPEQAGYEAGLITELLIQHLSEKAGVEVTVTLEVNARLPDGMEEQLARIMMECVRPRKVSRLELVNG